MRKSSLKRMLDSVENGAAIEGTRHKAPSSIRRSLEDAPTRPDETAKVTLPGKDIEDITDIASVSRWIQSTAVVMRENRELRLRFKDEPDRFLQSELDLDESIKKLHGLAVEPELYGSFVNSGGCRLVISLLNHVNEDISVEVLRVLVDLTDETVMDSVTDPEGFIGGFRQCAIVQVLSSTLTRFIDYSFEAVETVLQAVSNFVEIQPDLLLDFANSEMVVLLAKVIVKSESDWIYSRSLAVELLVSSLESLKSSKFPDLITAEVLESLLRALSLFCKVDPRDSEESEFLGNLVQVLCLALANEGPRETMAELQGIELFNKFLLSNDSKKQRIGLMLVTRAICDHTRNCHKFIDNFGLKPIGPLLESPRSEVKEHAVSVFQLLLKNSTGIHQTRTIHKLIEHNFAKLQSILNTVAVLTPAVGQDSGDTDFSRRWDEGLAVLQQASIVVLRLFNIGNVTIRRYIVHQMERLEVDKQLFITVLLEYIQLLNSEKAIEEITELQEFFITFKRKAC